jgi:DNA-binding PadR family transcriptional regulator
MNATDRARRRLRHDHVARRDAAIGRLRGFFDHGPGGGSVRRGNVRYAILAVIKDRPMHGYEVITELEARTGGRWRPSAGSVYPTLQLLEDEGLVKSTEVDGRRTYTLTDAGGTAAADVPTRWLDGSTADEPADLRRVAVSLIGAAVAVKRTGSPEANRAAREILVDSRKRLYRLLAEDVEVEA